MNNETIDVLIPVFNSAPYLEKCLESILSQTYQNIRIVIADDASTDGSTEIISRFASQHANIEHFVRTNEKSISKARNFLLGKIQSKYFTFFDSDDFAEPTYLETMYDLLCDFGVDMALCGKIRHKENAVVDAKKLTKDNSVILMNQQEAISEMLSTKMFNGTVYCKLMRTHTLQNCLFDEEIHYGEDLDFCFKIMQNCKTFAFSKQRLYHYIIRSGSIVSSKFNPKKLTCLTCYDKIINNIAQNQELLVCAKSMQGLIGVELLYYTFRDKVKNSDLKKSLKSLIKASIPFIKQNKKLMKLHRCVPYVWWLTKIM